jgi:tetrapyrrole methylase family protein/MazG family protein
MFHATLAEEAGQFTLADVARGVHDKLYTRHPHVFGAAEADDAGQVAANWEQIKKAEKGRASVFDGVPDALPALLFALKVQKKAEALEQGSTIGAGVSGQEAVGLPALRTLDDAQAHARAAGGGDTEAVGALLFAIVGAARTLGVDPENALRLAAASYRDQVQAREGTDTPPA